MVGRFKHLTCHKMLQQIGLNLNLLQRFAIRHANMAHLLLFQNHISSIAHKNKTHFCKNQLTKNRKCHAATQKSMYRKNKKTKIYVKKMVLPVTQRKHNL